MRSLVGTKQQTKKIGKDDDSDLRKKKFVDYLRPLHIDGQKCIRWRTKFPWCGTGCGQRWPWLRPLSVDIYALISVAVRIASKVLDNRHAMLQQLCLPVYTLPKNRSLDVNQRCCHSQKEDRSLQQYTAGGKSLKFPCYLYKTCLILIYYYKIPAHMVFSLHSVTLWNILPEFYPIRGTIWRPGGKFPALC